MEINFDEKYCGRKLKGSELISSLNLSELVHVTLLGLCPSSKKQSKNLQSKGFCKIIRRLSSEFAAILNLLVVLSHFLLTESNKKWTSIGISKEHRITWGKTGVLPEIVNSWWSYVRNAPPPWTHDLKIQTHFSLQNHSFLRTLGRLFNREDDQAGAERTVILSHGRTFDKGR